MTSAPGAGLWPWPGSLQAYAPAAGARNCYAHEGRDCICLLTHTTRRCAGPAASWFFVQVRSGEETGSWRVSHPAVSREHSRLGTYSTLLYSTLLLLYYSSSSRERDSCPRACSLKIWHGVSLPPRSIARSTSTVHTLCFGCVPIVGDLAACESDRRLNQSPLQGPGLRLLTHWLLSWVFGTWSFAAPLSLG
jgi:hypothetical protein